ncbi:unnamed protein product [Mortierella alpina]
MTLQKQHSPGGGASTEGIPAPLSGSLHHLSLSVTDMTKSVKFYKFLYEDILGFKELMITDDYAMWWKYGSGAIGISPARTKISHHKFNAGFHHMGLNLDSRQEIDDAYKKLQEFFAENKEQQLGEILDAPAEYEYMPGYYAVFFTDPDGMKFELVHTPREAYF